MAVIQKINKRFCKGEINFPTLIVFALIIFGLRMLLKRLMDKSVYRGSGFSVPVPEGWDMEKEEDEVIFYSPKKDPLTEVPEAIFSIYAKQSKGALFREDLFIQVLESLAEMNGRILDKGEIKVQGQIASWVLFYNKEPPLFIMTFYITDDFNRLTKIQFLTTPENFKKYREPFEKFKASIKFKNIF